jgi:hypothetical protein
LGENFNFKWWRGLLYQFNQYLPSEPNDYVGLNIIPMLIHSTKNNYPSNFLCGCGFGQGDLKVRYDGTLIHCQNAIAVLKPSEYLSTDNYTFKIQSELAK